MRAIALLAILAVLVGCGSGTSRGHSARGQYAAASTSGPIASACMRSDRKARSGALCGCIQQVAHMTLSEADQKKGASFWSDPQRAQDVRQSDNVFNEAFWLRWKNFGQTSEAMCS